MMRWLVNSSIQFRFLVLTVAVILMTFGITRLREMPVDVLPEFAPPFVEIQTEALGLSATEVEQLISLNLEELLSGTPWLQTIRSESVPGLSSLVLIFQPGTDILRARQLVQERLTLAHMLPNVSRPPVILQPLSATSRVLMVGMTSKDVSPIELGVLAPLEDSTRLDGSSRRRQRLDLGPARTAIAGAGRSATTAGPRRDARSGDSHRR